MNFLTAKQQIPQQQQAMTSMKMMNPIGRMKISLMNKLATKSQCVPSIFNIDQKFHGLFDFGVFM